MKFLSAIILSSFVLALAIMLASCGEDTNPPAPVDPTPVPEKVFKVKIGTPALAGMNYSWFPADSLDDAFIAQPMASPKKTTTYTVTTTSKCGQASSNVTVKVYKLDEDGQLVEIK